jgi:hypothetical protein
MKVPQSQWGYFHVYELPRKLLLALLTKFAIQQCRKALQAAAQAQQPEAMFSRLCCSHLVLLELGCVPGYFIHLNSTCVLLLNRDDAGVREAIMV